MIGLSANDLVDHSKWIDDINDISKTKLQFPVIADAKREVAWLYDMLSADLPARAGIVQRCYELLIVCRLGIRKVLQHRLTGYRVRMSLYRSV